METRYNILFVCMGNICRSPASENIFRQVVEEAGLSDRIHCDSAGTIGIHSGNKPDTRMSKTIRRRGYEVTGHARQFSLLDFDVSNLILTMDNENFQNILYKHQEIKGGPDFQELGDHVRSHWSTHYFFTP